MDMGFSSCPQKNRSGWYWLVSLQLDFATHPGVLVAIFLLSPMLEQLAFHPQNHSDRIWHALTFVVISSVTEDCQSLSKPFFLLRLPPQATEAGPADRQMLYSKCSPYALRRPLSNCDCCSGCSSHQTIRFQATFTGSRCAAAQGHDTTRVYSARSVAGKRATVRTSSKSYEPSAAASFREQLLPSTRDSNSWLSPEVVGAPQKLLAQKCLLGSMCIKLLWERIDLLWLKIVIGSTNDNKSYKSTPFLFCWKAPRLIWTRHKFW